MEQENRFPEGDALVDQIGHRHRSGTIWRVLFQISTLIGIIALTALLYNIINQAFGLVVVENEISPDALVRGYEEARVLGAPNTAVSENDDALAQAVMNEPYSLGFFGHAYFERYRNGNGLKLLSVEGVEPTAENAESGEYPLARPLQLYATERGFQEKPQVAAFVNYYLQHVNDIIEEVGYFPASETVLEEAREAWLEATGAESLAQVDPAQYEGEIVITGSSTLYPLTKRIAEQFEAEGFRGSVTVENTGTTAGLRALCVEGTTDLANASRPIRPAEVEACRSIERRPVAVQVGTDALTVVANPQNESVDNVSLEELGQLFTEAELWSEVNANWPAEPIQRFVPGRDSGTLDFFVESAFPVELADLPKEVLVSMLADNVSSGVGRRLEREQRFFENALVFESPETYRELCREAEPPEGCTREPRSQDDVHRLVVERVVQPEVEVAYSLVDSIFNRGEILAEAQRQYPAADVEFRAWLTPSFISSPQSDKPELAGVRTAILGSLWVLATTILFSFPFGVGAAIYLEEYASDNRLNRIIQTNINNLAGVPSIIYGMLGLAIFVRTLEVLTSGALFGAADPTTANGRTIFSAGLTLGLLILPIIIINAQEAIRAVPQSLRMASYGLGATKWQTIWSHVLPNAMPGILTGTILAMSRAIGETAPLVVVGASTFITFDPDGPFSKFTVLPIQIYQWTSRPQAEFRNIAAAAIIVLLILGLTMNATAVLLRNRFSKRLS